MRIGHSHTDVYDRESEYWQDIEDAKNVQIEAQKNSQSMAVGSERKNLYDKDILTQGD
ncbi:hypothetical protein J1907_02920 [Lysinibacillus sphaericus]|uniref:hypothetical protein n=1 Tax=Lysinibacillus sphaericus TaxID=1421 RepID=UPI000A4E7C5C|nr:hypothetical protein [Lysinibacillus sphaericus]QTB23084.1 hypothetical protein J1907_02920 [Lysinibacillus sphaericus]